MRLYGTYCFRNGCLESLRQTSGGREDPQGVSRVDDRSINTSGPLGTLWRSRRLVGQYLPHSIGGTMPVIVHSASCRKTFVISKPGSTDWFSRHLIIGVVVTHTAPQEYCECGGRPRSGRFDRRRVNGVSIMIWMQDANRGLLRDCHCRPGPRHLGNQFVRRQRPGHEGGVEGTGRVTPWSRCWMVVIVEEAAEGLLNHWGFPYSKYLLICRAP